MNGDLAGWRPIETAPKDGTHILAWFYDDAPMRAYLGEHQSGISMAAWVDHNGGGWVSNRWGTPTHWMPLPPPPGASPVASAPRGYDPANEPEALNFLHNILDLVKHGERAVMDFLALHGDRIQELVTAGAPEEEREATGTCGLFHVPLEDARRLMPDLPWDEAPMRDGVEYIADVKVHMLMPGQWPCIPNWHQDFVPRDPETLEERPDLLGPDNPPMLLWISGPPLTEFRDQAITTVPAKTWVEFTQFDEHRGVAATEHGWRTFIRLTPIEVMREGLPHQPIPAPRDQWIRKHTQVYLDAENFKW